MDLNDFLLFLLGSIFQRDSHTEEISSVHIELERNSEDGRIFQIRIKDSNYNCWMALRCSNANEGLKELHKDLSEIKV